MNKAIIMGRLTADPELKQTQSGISVTSFTVAVDRQKDKDGNKSADFISVTAWRERAEFISRYFSKGDPIIIDGRIQTRNYEDKQGNKRTAVEILCEHAEFVPGNSKKRDEREDDAEVSAPPKNTGNADFEEVTDDNDLPF